MFFKSLKNQDGMTLMEVLVAFAILVIIASAFIMLFSSSHINIFTAGKKTNAITQSNQLLQLVYNQKPVTETSIESTLNGKNGLRVASRDLLYTYDNQKSFNYYLEASNTSLSSGYNVTLVVFYNKGDRHIELTSFIKGGE